ncbi:MAG: hypothetical protein QXI07_08940 [Pyrobaculum sp.]
MIICPNPDYDYDYGEQEFFFDEAGNPAIPKVVRQKIPACPPDLDVELPYGCPVEVISCYKYPDKGFIVRQCSEGCEYALQICYYDGEATECFNVQDASDLEDLAEELHLPQPIVAKAAELLSKGVFEYELA